MSSTSMQAEATYFCEYRFLDPEWWAKEIERPDVLVSIFMLVAMVCVLSAGANGPKMREVQNRAGCRCKMPGMAILRMMKRNPGAGGDASQVWDPEDYLALGGESFVLVTVLSWTIGFVCKCKQLEANDIVVRFGYPNVCVAWDLPPALYFAIVLWNLVVYSSIMYARLDTTRAALSNVKPWQLMLTRVCNLLFLVTMCMSILIFVITPDFTLTEPYSLEIHVCLFMMVIFGRCVVIIGNFMETDQPLELQQKIYLAAFMTASATCFWVGFVNAFFAESYHKAFRDAHGNLLEYEFGPKIKHAEVVPKIIARTADYSWFALLWFTTAYMPPAPNLKISFELDQPYTPVDTAEKNGASAPLAV